MADNFFHLGGDSIRSIQVLALARQRGIDFSLQRLFQLSTIAALVGEAVLAAPEPRVREPFSMISAGDRARIPGDVTDAYPMAVLQAGMVFHMESDEDRRLYQNLDSFHVRGPFREEAFRLAVQQVVDRHDILRTSFHLSEYSQMLQLVHQRAELPVEVIDVRGLSEPEQLAAIGRVIDRERAIPFDLSRAPLLRFFVHWRSAQTFQWTLAEHHAILDGWSLHSTIAEILERYLALLRDPAAAVEPKPGSAYRDFIEAEQQALASPESRDFWLERMSDAPRAAMPVWPPGMPGRPGRHRGGPAAPRVAAAGTPPGLLRMAGDEDPRLAQPPARGDLRAARCVAQARAAGRAHAGHLLPVRLGGGGDRNGAQWPARGGGRRPVPRPLPQLPAVPGQDRQGDLD